MKTKKAKFDSTSMVSAVFEQLKTSGYTDSQILSFARDLSDMARGAQCQTKNGAWLESLMEYDLSLLGMPRQG